MKIHKIKPALLSIGMGNFYISLSLITISIIFLVLSLTMDKGQVDGKNLSPAFFPLTLSLLLILLNVSMICSSLFSNKKLDEFLKKEQAQKTKCKKEKNKSVILMLFTLIYLFLIPFLGFIISTVIFLLGVVSYFKLLTWLRRIVFVGGIVAFWYFLFVKILMVTFPSGYLGI